MHKKILLAVLGIVMLLVVLTSRGLNIAHWEETDWNVDSYDPTVPFLSLIGGLCYCGIVFFTAKGNIWLWMLGISWIAFSLILMWAMYFI